MQDLLLIRSRLSAMEEKIKEMTEEQECVDNEDAFDATIAEEAYREYIESGCKSTPIKELWVELGL